MTQNFGTDDEPSSRSPRQPPNYLSRAVQMRMLMLVGCLMMVIIAMIEARKPKYYRWLFPENVSEDAGDIDTRLLIPPVELQPDDEDATPKDAADETEDNVQIDVVHREQIATWTALLTKVKSEGRLLLYQVLLAGRERKKLTDEQKQDWGVILKQFDEGWEAYDAKASNAVLQMPDENPDKRVWLNVLLRLRSRWSQMKEVFDLIVQGRYLLPKDQEVLNDLEELFDEIALNGVKDKTFSNRPSESDAWFRMLDRVRTSSRKQLEEQSLGHVGFLELFRQPQTYRGKVVTIHGTARMAYHVRATKNIYGIAGYYIFIVKPNGGVNSPLTVYALETPPGFPEVKDRDLDRTTTTLFEEVEFTGYFFKNRAYRAKGGSFISPTLVARVAKWDGPLDEVDDWSELPSISTAIMGIVGVAAVGILLCVLIYRQNRGVSPEVARYDVSNRTSAESLKKLEKEAPTVTVEDRLRELSAAQHDAEQESNDEEQDEQSDD